MSQPLENQALGTRPHLDERPTYEPRARQERFIVGRLAEAIPAAIAAHAPRSGQALDVGCGRQPFRGLIERHGLAYIGLDTQQNVDQTVAHVCPIDAELPPELLARGPFAFILCTEVMEHVADWRAAFTNFTRLLAPGGKLLITCPHLYPLHEEPYDFWRPTPFSLRYFAAAYGLHVAEQREIGDGWDVLGTVLASVKPRAPKGSVNPLAYLAAFAAQALRACLLALAKRGMTRSLAPASTKLYLSNLIVLEKRA